MKITINRDRVKLFLWIALAWFVIWEFSNLVNDPKDFVPRTFNEIWRAIYVLVLTFIFFEYAFPFIVKKRKNIIGWVLIGIFVFWIMMMLYSYGLYAWRALGIALNIYTSYMVDGSTKHAVSTQMQFSAASILFYGITRHAYDYRKLKASAQLLRMEKQQAELNYLKSQTNPHFLFNTLNNIYALARDKSDLAPESILRLSKILRFMLYEAGGEYIAIDQELRIITDYIALEKLRYDESLRINFNHDIEDMKQSVPPLLLIPLVENAFKHGVSETRGLPFVDIHLSVNNRRLTFVVKNSSESPGSSDERVKENIGLSNLRRQLELLYREYDLTVQQGESVFTAILKINLASHV